MTYEVFNDLPFPYPDDEFPRHLGVVLQLTVARGELPALVVVHDPDGDWLIGDGVNDPNEDGACIISAMSHVIDQDPSIALLASMPIGRAAYRDKQTDPWEIELFTWDEES